MQPNQPYQPAPQAPPPPAPAPTPTPSPNNPHPPEYGFIMDPEKPQRHGLPSLPNNGSPVVKVIFILGGLLVLLILFVIIRGVISGGGGDTAALLTVVQDQQELVHLSNNAIEGQDDQEAALSTANKNFAVTTQATITSAQNELITYLGKNGKKVNVKALAENVSATTDQQLKTAATSSTYNSTFKQVMTDTLKDYQTDLQQAYKSAPGPKGRELLSKQYDGAVLLAKQLNTP